MHNYKLHTAISKTTVCKDCGWSIIQLITNDIAYQTHQLYKGHDYWGYCSNKLCKNHIGEPWDDNPPSFSKNVAESEFSTDKSAFELIENINPKQNYEHT